MKMRTHSAGMYEVNRIGLCGNRSAQTQTQTPVSWSGRAAALGSAAPLSSDFLSQFTSLNVRT